MTQKSCARAWEVAAIEDGRLSAAERASFERHAKTCTPCTEERRALTLLRETAERLPFAENTPLARRRARNELLRRADAQSKQSARVNPGKMILVAAGCVVAVLMAWSVLSPSPKPRSPVPQFRIAAASGSDWSTLEEGATLRLSLRRGQAELEVHKLNDGQRFVVQLPDGELEVKGTRFFVEVEGERTRNVRVTEGRVELRLSGEHTRLLEAGATWSKVQVADAVKHTTENAIEKSPPPSRRGPKSKPPVIRESNAGAELKRAMAAFSSGDFGTAERLFADFERAHPSDARAEDAAFLAAVARARSGDVEGSKKLAREYLTRYPQGLRRSDAERMAEAR